MAHTDKSVSGINSREALTYILAFYRIWLALFALSLMARRKVNVFPVLEPTGLLYFKIGHSKTQAITILQGVSLCLYECFKASSARKYRESERIIISVHIGGLDVEIQTHTVEVHEFGGFKSIEFNYVLKGKQAIGKQAHEGWTAVPGDREKPERTRPGSKDSLKDTDLAGRVVDADETASRSIAKCYRCLHEHKDQRP
ncbi:hypothetical protein BDV93DRAFT_515057 [Ceratobasidium sp. AG-I]|nr:hypothetical protein BDV93DRAFT_515057 [Ceratobasidium sp. AG-I]